MSINRLRAIALAFRATKNLFQQPILASLHRLCTCADYTTSFYRTSCIESASEQEVSCDD